VQPLTIRPDRAVALGYGRVTTIDMPRDTVTQRLNRAFLPPMLVMAALSCGFALFVVVIGANRMQGRVKWLHLAYAATFLTMAVVVVTTLVSLYSEGAQAKSQALANSLGQRLKDIVEYDLNLKEFVGLDHLFADYRRLNDDIASAGLTVNEVVVAHTKPDLVGRPWVSDRQNYEYVVDLTPPSHPLHTQRQSDRHNGRQAFRHGRHRQGHHRQKQVG
jgi:hypothetical protein